MTDVAREQRVGSGLWWSGATWTLRSVQAGGGALPAAGAPWRRVPDWVLLPLAPVVGGIYLVALPVVGALVAARAVGRRLLAGGGRAARDLAAAVTAPAPSPGEAHLTGGPEAQRPPAGGPASPGAPTAGDGPLDEAAAEVRRARSQAGRG